MARRDGLTGLLTRRAFTESASRVLARKTGVRAVMLVDLDQFKEVNDAHGHAAGDEFLVICAERLGAALGGDDLLCRFGGDEFCVLVDAVDGRDVVDRAERLRGAVAEVRLAGRAAAIRPSASIGVVLDSPPGAPLEALIGEADLAMYRGKADGGNRVVLSSRRVLMAGDDRTV